MNSVAKQRTKRIELYPVQYDFVTCADRFTAFIAGIGAGKSFAGGAKGASLALPGTLGLVVAPTYPMLRDATIRTYRDMLGGAFNLHKGEMRGEVAGGGEILFRSADKPDSLRGPNIHWSHVDEGALCPPGTWEIVIGRLRADGRAGPCFVTSTPKGRNWLYQRSGEMHIFRAHTADNPYLAAEFVESLEAAYTGKFAAQELRGEFVGFEGLVYEEFDRNLHVAARNGPWKRVILGADEGYTNPAVLLAVAEDGDGRLHVLEEFYQRRVLQGDVVKATQRMVKRYEAQSVQVDPSAAGLIAEMRAAGLPAQPADNAVTEGIQRVKAHLAQVGDGRPRLTIAPSCVNLIAEFESYCWKESREGMRDEPDKSNDHAMDALRYATMGLTSPPPRYIAFL